MVPAVLEISPEPVRGLVVDLGNGGASFWCRAAVPPLAEARLLVNEGDVGRLALPVQVCHCHRIREEPIYAVGLRFVPANPTESAGVVLWVHSVFRGQAGR